VNHRRRGRLIGSAIAIYGVVSVAVSLALAESATSAPSEMHLPRTAVFAAGILAFAVPAALVIGRDPANPVGWVLAWVAVASGFTDMAAGYAAFALYGPGLPGGPVAAWLVSWTYAWALCPAGTLLFLLFPTGRLPTPSWRPVAWLAALATLGSGLSYAVLPAPMPIFEDVEKPFTVVGNGDVIFTLLVVSITVFLVTSVMSAASLWYRARGATSTERQQLKWVAYAAGLVSLTAVAIFIVGVPLVIAADLLTYTLLTIPLAVAVAMLRYHLYDIDLLINRSVVYGATTAAIALTFWLGIIGLQGILSRLTSGSEIAVAASTLISFALFQPIRRRLQDVVDRRFDRSRYDAARTLDAFADRLRDEVDLDALRADLLSAVSRTMAPAHAGLWLRERAK
jgi:MFS family permease